MALKGTLRDFGLSDIFQLIALQKKTGILSLEDRGKRVVVSFYEGKLVGAEALSEKTKEKERVGDILVKGRFITPTQLEQALAEQRKTMKKLGVVLVERKLVTRELFGSVLSFQIRETLLKIFQWTSGNYHFDTAKVEFDREFITPLTAEFVLMEAARIIDEWPAVRKRIPGSDMVFALIPGAEDRVARATQVEDADFLEDKPHAFAEGKVPLSTAQARIFDLVDGVRTVEELAYQSLLGEFEACKCLVDLVNSGLVKPTRASTTVLRGEEQGKGREAASQRNLLGWGATVLAAAAFLIALFWLFSHSEVGLASLSRWTGDKATALRGALAQSQERRLSLAMEVQRLERGAYPAHLGDLSSAGLLLPSDLLYPFGEPWEVDPASPFPPRPPVE